MPRADDVILTGSTMLKCAKLLRELGAVSVWAYVTHGQFTQVLLSVRSCVCVRARAGAFLCVCACVRAWIRVCLCVCVLAAGRRG